MARWGNVTSVVESRQPVCEMAVGVKEEREYEEGDLEPSAGMNNLTPEQPKYGDRVVPEAGLNGTVAIEDVDEDVDEVWCLSESGLAVCGADEPHQTPLNPMAAEFSPRPRIPMKCDAEVRDSIRLHSVIKRSGMPNFRGCRIPIKTGLNIGEIRELAVGFPDGDAIDFLEYGFPISFVGEVHQTLPPGNHKGAREFPEAIDDYVRRECELGATLGPFAENPLEDSALAISPLNSVPKTNASERRVILDLSFPPGRGINDGIAREQFLGEPYKLSLSGTDNMTQLIHRKGQGCLLFKRDLSRAFRQFPVDPADLDKLGFEWRGDIYIDRVLAMGLRTAGIACQRATNIIVYICEKEGVIILNYFDDLGGAERKEKAQWAFNLLGGPVVAAGVCWICFKGLWTSHQNGFPGNSLWHRGHGYGSHPRESARHAGGSE